MKKFACAALSTALLASMLAACGSSASTTPAASSADTSSDTGASSTEAAASTGAAADGSLHVAMNTDIQTMDVHKTNNDYMVPLNIFDRLFEIKTNADGSTELEKSLVEDYTVSDDGLTYDFTLRSGVTFSDGTPLTANDVKYTFTRMLALPDSVQTDYGSAIAGAEAVMDGTATDLEGIQVIDDTHFTVTLSDPFAGFLYELATASCSIMSEKNVEEAGDQFGMDCSKTIGSGPYVVTSWTRDSSIVLDANPNYWGEKPSVQHVEISIVPDSSTMSMMFQNGELDILDCDYIDAAVVNSTYKTQYADDIVTSNRLGTTYMALNENVEPLNDVKVRKAIQMAIDRQTILDTVYNGDGSLVDGIYPKGLIGYTEDNEGWLKTPNRPRACWPKPVTRMALPWRLLPITPAAIPLCWSSRSCSSTCSRSGLTPRSRAMTPPAGWICARAAIWSALSALGRPTIMTRITSFTRSSVPPKRAMCAA